MSTHQAELRALEEAERFTEMEAFARSLTVVTPGLGSAWTAYGKALLFQERPEDARPPLQKAALLAPDDVDAHRFLGVACDRLGLLAEAETAYRRTLELSPELARVHANLANVLAGLNRFAEAEASCRRSLVLDAGDARTHKILGLALARQGRFDEAGAAYLRAGQLDPDDLEDAIEIAGVLGLSGHTAEALAVYQKLLAANPDDAVAAHLIHALSASDIESIPADYAVTVFDNYAASYDAHLVGVLDYHVPEQLAALVLEALPAQQANVLDLGCGTGLVGAALAQRAANLVGVDASSGMLEQARARKVYTRLVNSDLLAMMRDEPPTAYDAVTAGYVFEYVGRMDDIAAQAKRLLRPGGVFAFSVEALDPLYGSGEAPHRRDVQLLGNGRFAHSSAYLNRLAAQCGFAVRHFSLAPLRTELGKPLQGWFATWTA
jgi:predicted TPR repeat methyltransferase